MDFRLAKSQNVRGKTLRGTFDIYNLLNMSAILNVNMRYGANWLQPKQILDARLFKFSAQLELSTHAMNRETELSPDIVG